MMTYFDISISEALYKITSKWNLFLAQKKNIIAQQPFFFFF